MRKSTTKYENILEKRYYFIRDEIIDGLKNGRWPKISGLLNEKEWFEEIDRDNSFGISFAFEKDGFEFDLKMDFFAPIRKSELFFGKKKYEIDEISIRIPNNIKYSSDERKAYFKKWCKVLDSIDNKWYWDEVVQSFERDLRLPESYEKVIELLDTLEKDFF